MLETGQEIIVEASPVGTLLSQERALTGYDRMHDRMLTDSEQGTEFVLIFGPVVVGGVLSKLSGIFGAGDDAADAANDLRKVEDAADDAAFARPVSVPPSAVGRIHGNSLASPRTAYLYRLEDAEGNFLKWGVTQDMAKRYPQSYMLGKRIEEVARGTRADIIRVERGLVETQPGPLNFERWAGSRLGEQP